MAHDAQNLVTQEQKIATLAEKVMGWTWKPYEGGHIRGYWACMEDGDLCLAEFEDWNPFTSWTDAGMLVDKTSKAGWVWNVDINKSGAIVTATKGLNSSGIVVRSTGPEAIANAAYAAVEGITAV